MLTEKQKHSLGMWAADIVGSILGGMIIAMWIGVMTYQVADLGSPEKPEYVNTENNYEIED